MRQDGSPGSCGILLLFSGGIQMKNWVLLRKGGNFTKIGERFHIHPRTAALIRNRDIIGEEAVDRYLNGTIADLYDGMLMKDMDKAVDLLKEKLTEGQSIRIIGDYDIDGVNATYILLEGLTGLGARVDYDIPDRIRDGYGLNIDLIDRALDDDIDTIITCDNGIAAKNEIAYGKSMGMSIIVTDHHEVPYEEKEDGTREFQIPPADAVVDIKREDCLYPYKGLCGAAVAYKLIEALYNVMGKDPEDVDYLVFPRLAALAEVAWTQPEKKDWTSFLKGMDSFNEHLSAKGIVYARSMYNIQHTVRPEDGALKVKLECVRPDVEIRYTMDGSEPTAASPLYEQPLLVKEAQTVNAATFADGQQMGKRLTLPVHWNKATAKPLLGNKVNEAVLNNGVRGSLKQTDFEWCSWGSSDRISFTVDLLQKEKMNTLTIGCITNYGMGVHKPKSIRVAVSDDNATYRDINELEYTPEEIFREGTFIEDLSIDMRGTVARYVRVTTEGAGECPANHVRPGQESRVCFDELIIE